MTQIYPNTPVRWPDPEDAPGEDAEIEHAHVVINGNRMTIRQRIDSGAYDAVDTLIEVVSKGNGKNTTVTGKSMFMINRIGLDPEESEVTVVFDGSPSKCLNC